MSNIKLVCFDIDDTLITENSWEKMNLALGMTTEEDMQLYHEFVSGVITYEVWMQKLLAHYVRHGDATREGITSILSGYKLAPYAREVVTYLRERDYELVLISGSTNILVELLAHDLGISYYRSNNELVFDDEGKLINIHTHGNDTRVKADHLEAFCELLGLDIVEAACIADGANDIEMFRRTGHGITFRGSKIERDAWKVIDSLAEIPTIL